MPTINSQPHRNRLPMPAKPRRVRLFSSAFLLAAVSLAGVGAPGCGSDQASKAAQDSALDTSAQQRPDGPAGERHRFNSIDNTGLQVETADLNDDGKPDQFTYKNAQRVVRVERDMNFDGQIDIWQYFDDASNLLEEEMDLDYDNKIDLVVFYKDGVVERKAMSVGFGGAFTIEKFYDGEGKLLRVERDQDNDGVTDLWEYYNADGKRERIGWDTNGDGTPDEFDQLP